MMVAGSIVTMARGKEGRSTTKATTMKCVLLRLALLRLRSRWGVTRQSSTKMQSTNVVQFKLGVRIGVSVSNDMLASVGVPVFGAGGRVPQ